MQEARIKLSSSNVEVLNDLSNKIVNLAKKAGVKVSGPIPLPTRKIVVPVRKSPCGGGTETFEKWHLRIHKRLIDIRADDRTIRKVLKVEIPENVHIEIILKE